MEIKGDVDRSNTTSIGKYSIIFEDVHIMLLFNGILANFRFVLGSGKSQLLS